MGIEVDANSGFEVDSESDQSAWAAVEATERKYRLHCIDYQSIVDLRISRFAPSVQF